MTSESTNLGDKDLQGLQRTLDIGALYRERVDMYEKNRFSEWLNALTPEEMQYYETIGMQFQLLLAFCNNPEMRALSADPHSAEKFSFREVVQIVHDMEKSAKSFLGRELERKPNKILDQLTSAYNQLRVLAARIEAQSSFEENDEYSVTATPVFDQELMDILNKMPLNIVQLLKTADDEGKSDTKNIRAHALRSLSRDLQFNEQEVEQFKNALKVMIRVRRKFMSEQKKSNRDIEISLGFDDEIIEGEIEKPLELKDLKDIVEALGRVECLRRVYPANPDLGARETDKMLGLNEIHHLLGFIKSWEEIFTWLSEMKHGKIFQLPEESEEDHEDRMEEKNAKIRDIIENFTKSFTLIFPHRVAPMILRYHRRFLKERVQRYPELGRIVNSIEDTTVKKDLKQVMFRISTILSYLDFMWSMHEVEENSAGKQLIYPKKMLLLAPMILQETESLAAFINILEQQYRGTFEDEAKTGETAAKHEAQTSGLGVRYEEVSQMFRLSPSGIMETTHDGALSISETQTEEDRQKMAKRLELADTLELLGGMMSFVISNSRATIRSTKVKKVMVNEETDEGSEQKTRMTLSYEVHDFINDLNDLFGMILKELAVFYNGNMSRRDLMPEIAEQERQAAKLRTTVYAFGTNMRPIAEILGTAMKADPQQIRQETLPSIRHQLVMLTNFIKQFREYQEGNLSAQKYHEVLRGAGLEKLTRLANTIDVFDAENIDENTLLLYTGRKRIEEFSTKLPAQMGRELRAAPEVNAWIKEVESLGKIEDRILSNGMRAEEMEAAKLECTQKFINVLNEAQKLAKENTHFLKFCESNTELFATTADQFTSTYYKFYKLVRLIGDVGSVCDLQLDPKTPAQQFLVEHDMEESQKLANGCRILANTDYDGMSEEQMSEAKNLIAECREAAQHLIFRSHDRALKIDHDLAELEKIILSSSPNVASKSIEKSKKLSSLMETLGEFAEEPITF